MFFFDHSDDEGEPDEDEEEDDDDNENDDDDDNEEDDDAASDDCSGDSEDGEAVKENGIKGEEDSSEKPQSPVRWHNMHVFYLFTCQTSYFSSSDVIFEVWSVLFISSGS